MTTITNQGECGYDFVCAVGNKVYAMKGFKKRLLNVSNVLIQDNRTRTANNKLLASGSSITGAVLAGTAGALIMAINPTYHDVDLDIYTSEGIVSLTTSDKGLLRALLPYMPTNRR